MRGRGVKVEVEAGLGRSSAKSAVSRWNGRLRMAAFCEREVMRQASSRLIARHYYRRSGR